MYCHTRSLVSQVLLKERLPSTIETTEGNVSTHCRANLLTTHLYQPDLIGETKKPYTSLRLFTYSHVQNSMLDKLFSHVTTIPITYMWHDNSSWNNSFVVYNYDSVTIHSAYAYLWLQTVVFQII